MSGIRSMLANIAPGRASRGGGRGWWGVSHRATARVPPGCGGRSPVWSCGGGLQRSLCSLRYLGSRFHWVSAPQPTWGDLHCPAAQLDHPGPQLQLRCPARLGRLAGCPSRFHPGGWRSPVGNQSSRLGGSQVGVGSHLDRREPWASSLQGSIARLRSSRTSTTQT